jgi:cytoskeleton protein RodZ
MDSVFTLLKQAREAKSLSLNDVADATFISVRYLEAIEAGKTDMLPQAYVRAFIREYAAVVGLDAAAVMRQYAGAAAPQAAPPSPPAEDAGAKTRAERAAPSGDEQPAQATPASTPEEPRIEHAPAAPPPTVEIRTPEPSAPAPHRDLTDIVQKAAIVMGVAVVAVVLWNIMGIEKPKSREIPFQNVITENELHAAGPGRKDSTKVPATQASRTDSLTLQAVTMDSVWVQVIIDGGTPREYLFRPNSRASWKAGEKFLLTIGNAGAVQLTLNKKDLGPLGKKGAVIQKLELTRQSLAH